MTGVIPVSANARPAASPANPAPMIAILSVMPIPCINYSSS
ncbi:hypothetical protein MGWOODY_Hyp1957 [hydrothermal vent metagenome]|uniref:Uncharacterized protein n=1 Tax=hydrothermal vent metagenome TaxID=652676 RepID=A0A160TZL8_9ZZZZ